MFFYTDTADTPWTVIKSDDKKRAQLACMQHFLANLPYPERDPEVVVGPAEKVVDPASRWVRPSDGRFPGRVHRCLTGGHPP